jgi:hypothetical protein
MYNAWCNIYTVCLKKGEHQNCRSHYTKYQKEALFKDTYEVQSGRAGSLKENNWGQICKIIIFTKVV